MRQWPRLAVKVMVFRGERHTLLEVKGNTSCVGPEESSGQKDNEMVESKHIVRVGPFEQYSGGNLVDQRKGEMVCRTRARTEGREVVGRRTRTRSQGEEGGQRENQGSSSVTSRPRDRSWHNGMGSDVGRTYAEQIADKQGGSTHS